MLHISQLVAPTRAGRRADEILVLLSLSVSSIALFAVAPALAQGYPCPTPVADGTETCTIPAGEGYSYALIDDSISAPTNYTAINNATMTPAVSPGQNRVLEFYIAGDAGDEDSPAGVKGSVVTLTNNADLTFAGPDGTTPDTGLIIAVDASGQGGDGAEPKKSGNNGGRGGDGGTVSVTNNGTITIDGAASDGSQAEVIGIRVFSNGGNGGTANTDAGNQPGGNGGDGKYASINNNGDIRIGSTDDPFEGYTGARGFEAWGSGGAGGANSGEGGTGPIVSITNTAKVDLQYRAMDDASSGIIGIYGNSKGGNGYNANDNSFTGGNGEDGKMVTITNSGDVNVSASFASSDGPSGASAAIFAQSIGGIGGISPNKNAGGVGGSASVDDNLDPSVTTVTVNGPAAVTTDGAGIMGVVARSIGGAGGDGNTKGDSTGGKGGAAGEIQLNLQDSASVTTQGAEAYAIAAQSIGGLGGVNAATTAGTGGDAGAVGLFSDTGTKVTTSGDYAAGVTLHSVGGGGGFGSDFTGVLAGSGGNGGNGGDAGQVEITSGSTVQTSGQYAHGLLVQSIGGSGGAGGVGDSLVLGLGGDGGAGGTSGNVIVNNTGAVHTTGYGAHAVLAQSISGGGGAAGMSGGVLSVGGQSGSGGNDKTAYVTTNGTVSTAGDAATGVLVQAIGGGGGSASGSDGIFTIGGSGSSGGNGGTAEVYVVGGSVATLGQFSHGVAVQSIGGGGGSGGDVLDLSVGVGVGIGGDSSVGGSGGVVCATNTYGSSCEGVSDSGSEAPARSSSTISTAGDFSIGVLTHSVGGGGGTGGTATGVGVLELASLLIGGNGSGGGNGGAATTDFTSLSLTTTGNNAPGIVTQSIGGGGGTGGSAVNVDAVNLVPIQVGGKGGVGTLGGTATATLAQSTLGTLGAHSAGVIVQSVGGGGGTGGSASGYDASVGFAMDTSVGAAGGAGGGGGNASVSLTDTTISTSISGTTVDNDASDSHGILVQSIGGGGGNGGTSVADALTLAVPTGEGVSFAATISTTIGGASGTGGGSESASATLSGSSIITTGGDGSMGILAQSVAGGGGSGGSASSFAGTIGDPTTESMALSTSLGANGGSGGNAGSVIVQLEDQSAIATFGDVANAITAQSVGGGGGNGSTGNATDDKIGRGFHAGAVIGLGGSGGAGGNSGAVSVTLEEDTTLTTFGSNARGVVAQSVAGGGGTSQGGTIGLAASGLSSDTDENGNKITLKGNVTVNVGMGGPNGASGGAVTVVSDGVINTTGSDSDGVFAQSVGGSGGIGGSAGADAGFNSQKPFQPGEIPTSYTLSAAIGGKGGTGGNGGALTLTQAGLITTMGDWADGFVAQSIGGGGGAGGTSTVSGSGSTASIALNVGGTGGAGGNGGAVTTTFNGDNNVSVTTHGYGATGVLLQSIGGGGGQGADGSDSATGTISLGGGIGGNGGASGNGGTVELTQYSWVKSTTHGDDAAGLLVQSIGGGGGVAGSGNTAASDNADSHTIELVVGGDGGASGDGGTLGLNFGTAIGTTGDRSFGIVAQSIGGGGGVGGSSSADSIASLRFGGTGGASGNGGAVNMTITEGSIIATSGTGAHAIIAQSIGGGGGIAGDAGAGPLGFDLTSISTSDTPAGGGENLVLDVDATINTTGDRAFGIIAQSLGGGGGFAGTSEGVFAGITNQNDGTSNAGAISITQSGTLTTSGEGSVGIFAQSLAPISQDSITIEVKGDVTGGSGSDGAAIFVYGGGGFQAQGNTLTIEGGANVTAGDGGDAIRYLSPYTTAGGQVLNVENYGTVTGDIILSNADSDSAGTVNNYSSNTLLGGTLYQADIVNQGRFVIGGAESIEDVRITGDLSQTAAGTLQSTVDFAAGQAVLLTVQGDADLAGTISLATTSLMSGRDLTVLTVEGAISGDLEAEDTAVVDFETSRVGNSYSVSIADTQFAGAAASANGASVGSTLDSLFDQSAPKYAGLLGDLNQLASQDNGEIAYARALSSLSLGGTPAAAAVQTELAQGHLDQVLSCPSESNRAVFADGSCVWFGAGGSYLDQQGPYGYDGTLWGVAGGAQIVLNPNWTLGVAIGYEDASYDGNNGFSSSDGGSVFGGVSLGYEINNLFLSAAIAGSHGRYDTSRRLDLPGFVGTSTGENDITTLSARLHAAYLLKRGTSYVKPFVNLDSVSIDSSGYTESGTGLYDLAVSGQKETAFVFTPAVEFGTAASLGNGWNSRLFATVGVSISSMDSWTTSAQLANAPAGTFGFETSLPVSDVTGRVSLGAELWRGEGFDARIEYHGAFGDDYRSHAAMVKLTKRF